jgi:hypothetical protein
MSSDVEAEMNGGLISTGASMSSNGRFSGGIGQPLASYRDDSMPKIWAETCLSEHDSMSGGLSMQSAPSTA